MSTAVALLAVVLTITGAVAAGQTKLKLVYRRAWEGRVPPIKTFGVTIVVR